MDISNGKEILELINIYGVLPILLFVIWKLWKLLKQEKMTSEERLKEMLGSDVEDKVERTKLIENDLALMEKFIEKYDLCLVELSEIKEEIKRSYDELNKLKIEIQSLKNKIDSNKF